MNYEATMQCLPRGTANLTRNPYTVHVHLGSIAYGTQNDRMYKVQNTLRLQSNNTYRSDLIIVYLFGDGSLARLARLGLLFNLCLIP